VTPFRIDRLQLDVELTRRLIVNFIRQEITKTGMRRGVLGVSGGVDSALVAFLTTEALGRENVLALLLPHSGLSNPASEADGRRVIAHLDIPWERVDLAPLADPYLALYPDISDRRRGNILARLRMIVLYDHSERFGGLVIGTSNRTETLLGYTTIYGDNAAAIQPIADLYKCQVRQLAQAVGVPEPILTKPPSADLWAGQTDEGELGFTYDEADQILYLLFEQRYRPGEVIALGFDERVVRRIVELVRRNQFKRVPPPVCKLGQSTVNWDFLYPRDWGI